MEKIMISQPMAGKTDREIEATRDCSKRMLEDMGYKVVDTLLNIDESKIEVDNNVVAQIPLYYLSKSLEYMSLCDAVYFCEGWENARGCKIEHEAAKAYGLKVIHESKGYDIADITTDQL